MKKILDNTRPLTCLHFNKKSFLAQKTDGYIAVVLVGVVYGKVGI